MSFSQSHKANNIPNISSQDYYHSHYYIHLIIHTELQEENTQECYREVWAQPLFRSMLRIGQCILIIQPRTEFFFGGGRGGGGAVEVN